MKPISLSKGKKLAIIFTLFLLTIIAFLSNYSFVTIDKPSDLENEALLLIHESGEEKEINPGFNVIKKGRYTAHLETQDKETKKDFIARPFSHQVVTLKLMMQKQTYKVATEANTCLVGSLEKTRRGEVLSYDCASNESLIKNDYKQRLFGQRISTPSPSSHTLAYKDGLLILKRGDHEPDETSLSYFDGISEQSSRVSSWAGDKSPENYRLAVDNDRFYILDIEANQVYEFIDMKNRPKSHKLGTELGTMGTTFKVFEGRYYIFNAADEHENEGSDDFHGGKLLVSDSVSGSSFKDYAIPEDAVGIDGFSVIDQGRIAFFNAPDRAIDIYEINEEFNLMNSITNSLGYVVISGNLYTVDTDGRVYEYNFKDDSSYLVFKSNNVLISDVSTLSGHLVINGYSRSLTEPSSGISLLVEKTDQRNGVKLEDVFPVDGYTEDSAITYVDYLGDQITVSLLLASKITDKQSGVISFDAQEFEIKKKKALEEISALGLDVSKYKFTFTDI